jgi:hypothetical protein
MFTCIYLRVFESKSACVNTYVRLSAIIFFMQRRKLRGCDAIFRPQPLAHRMGGTCAQIWAKNSATNTLRTMVPGGTARKSWVSIDELPADGDAAGGGGESTGGVAAKRYYHMS